MTLALQDKIRGAQSRIFLSSLYLGHEQQELLEALDTALRTKPNLHVNLQLDYFRSTRPGPDSPALALLSLLRAYPDRMHVHLYRSPTLRGLMAKVVPRRFDEGWGTWHAKLYGIDDDIIISGANLNKSYFVDRQDRYFVFSRNQRLTNYCSDFLRMFSAFSYKLLPTGNGDGYQLSWVSTDVSPTSFVPLLNQRIRDFQASQRMISSSSDSTDNSNVELFPVIQSGPLSIREEELALSNLLYAAGSSPSAQVDLTSGYFALYDPYQHQVFASNCHWRILAASPKANGFYGSKGISGRIPHGYTILEQRFWRGVKHAGKTGQVDLREWEKPNWTYHAKGIWIRPSPDADPTVSVFGSTNLNSRSANLDTELSFILHTESSELRRKLADEVDNIWTHAQKVGDETWKTPERNPPLMTRLIVALVGKML